MTTIEYSPAGAFINEDSHVMIESKELGQVEGKRPSPGRDKNLVKRHFDSDFYYPPMGEN